MGWIESGGRQCIIGGLLAHLPDTVSCRGECQTFSQNQRQTTFFRRLHPYNVDRNTVFLPYTPILPRSRFRRLGDRKSTRLNSSHSCATRMPYSACKKKQQPIQNKQYRD